MTAPLEFWFEFASTYSYPAAMRVEALCTTARVALRWRPFLLGPLFAAQGWRDSPFNLYPAKGAYMWRDLARVCAGEAKQRLRAHTEAFASDAQALQQAQAFLDFARQHRDVIGRFGRFPHRNGVLGRPSTPQEVVYLADGGHRFGQ